MKNILFYLVLFCCTTSFAQSQTFIERLTRNEVGKGVVRIHQSATITNLVNGITIASHTLTPPKETSVNTPSTVTKRDTIFYNHAVPDTSNVQLGTKVRVNGFRIQIFSGGNSRQDKLNASNYAQRSKSFFPNMEVYTGFVSPHWMCRVGDFTTREEAIEVLNQMRETGRFPEAVVVKSKVNVYY